MVFINCHWLIADLTKVTKIRDCKTIADLDLRTERPKRLWPTVQIFDVACDLTDAEIIDNVYDRNLVDKGCEKKSFMESAKVITRLSKREGCSNVIMRWSQRYRR